MKARHWHVIATDAGTPSRRDWEDSDTTSVPAGTLWLVACELDAWVDNHPDHPRAAEIDRLADDYRGGDHERWMTPFHRGRVRELTHGPGRFTVKLPDRVLLVRDCHDQACLCDVDEA